MILVDISVHKSVAFDPGFALRVRYRLSYWPFRPLPDCPGACPRDSGHFNF